MSASNNETRLVRRDGPYTTISLDNLIGFAQAVDNVLGGGSVALEKLVFLLNVIKEGKAPALQSCACFALTISKYPLFCPEHAHLFMGTTPAAFVIVGPCPEHIQHYRAITWGASFTLGVMEGREDTQTAAEALLDELDTEDKASEFVKQLQNEAALHAYTPGKDELPN
jgi:hypothetical protein